MPASDVLSAEDVVGIRALVADLTYADAYQVERDAIVPNGRGGRSTVASVVEAGPCRLLTSGLRGDEEPIAQRVGWESHYAVLCRYDTTATPKDRLIVNGTRRFEIGEVTRGGEWGLQARIVCRETG